MPAFGAATAADGVKCAVRLEGRAQEQAENQIIAEPVYRAPGGMGMSLDPDLERRRLGG